MKWFLRLLCFSFLPLYAGIDEAWLRQAEQNYDKSVSEWLRAGLSQEILKKTNKSQSISTLPNGKCLTGAKRTEEEPTLRVFISFSVPDETWLHLSQDIADVNGVFVLQGLPNNSFRDFAKRLVTLRERGLSVQVDIDPKVFKRYEITRVPAFVIAEDGRFDKVTGNVSIGFAIDLMARQGDTAMAKSLMNRLKDRM